MLGPDSPALPPFISPKIPLRKKSSATIFSTFEDSHCSWIYALLPYPFGSASGASGKQDSINCEIESYVIGVSDEYQRSRTFNDVKIDGLDKNFLVVYRILPNVIPVKVSK